MIGSRLGELGVKRLDDIRIGRSGLGDLQGAETVLRGHKVHEVGVDGVGDVDEELIRSAAIDGGKRSMWVIFDRSSLLCLAVYVRFVLKADMRLRQSAIEWGRSTTRAKILNALDEAKSVLFDNRTSRLPGD